MTSRRALLLPAILLFSLSFLPQTALATFISFTGFQADMTSTIDPDTGNETLSLLINSTRFGSGGIASGLAAVSVSPPDDSRWVVDPFLISPPDDGTPALSFLLSPGGTILGIEANPFFIFSGFPPPDDGTP